MATGTKANFAIYDEQVHSGFVEVLPEVSAAFNGQSAGAIVLNTENLRGDYADQSFLQNTAGLISDRDPTDVATKAGIPLNRSEFTSVKRNTRIGPVEQTLDSFKKMGNGGDYSEQIVSRAIGAQIAKATQVDQITAAISSLNACMEVDAANVEHVVGGPMVTTALADGLSKVGDRQGGIVAWAMTSKPFFELMKDQMSNQPIAYSVGGIVILQGSIATLNRPVIHLDNASLIDGLDHYTLGLQAGACTITDSEPPSVVSEMVTGLGNLVVRYQGEGAYNCSVMGYAWDKGAGGAAPSLAALGTAANWQKAVDSHKDGPGLRITTT